MSITVPVFDHVTEYARYGGTMPGALKKKIVPVYPGTFEIIVLPDDFQGLPIVSNYRPRVRGFLYHHGFRCVQGDKGDFTAQHFLSFRALGQLREIIGDKKEEIVEIYGMLAHLMNHDMLHGFNGDPQNFREFDSQLIFGGVEFFSLMAHSEIVERWLKRDGNKDFLLQLGRNYVFLLKPLAEEYQRTHDDELLKLLDYFVLIYQKCLLTFLPLSNEVVLKFNGGVNKLLHNSMAPCIVTRERYDILITEGLDKGTTKNNDLIGSDPSYNKKKTGAAMAAQKLLDNQFSDGETQQLVRIVHMTLQNLFMGGCFRMVPDMDRPANLQKKFQKIYMNK